ncbi:ORF6N domain-containing protein [Sulfurimonas sediminis]|uniref:ORF6N domain-containing protein n=1 Tax=Sulfurimonas sediminis TaxID=2590020 RepID=UPI001D03C823|nr:ORF6N domain-containing protein [Sulfurimonas sediminis]
MNELIIDNQTIQNKIYTIRDTQVMVDSNLAELYGVQTKRINEAVKNNLDKFQEDFFFQLNDEEFSILRSKVSTTKFAKTRINPKVFTEQGVYMLATILKSKTASQTTVFIIRTFANMRKFLLSNASIFQRLDTLETKQIQTKLESDEKFKKLFDAIEEKGTPQKQYIFYDGQIFDAYLFVSDIIKSAKTSIKLIDNFIDESTLVLFTKSDANIKTTIYTKTISKQLQLDLKRYNSQYQPIEIKKFDLSLWG